MRRLLRALHHHFFEPASLRDLGVLRIVLVGTQLLYLLFDARLVLGEPGGFLHRQVLLAHAPNESFEPLPALKVLMLPFGWGTRPEPMFLQFVWGLALLSGVFALIGRYTRLSLVGLAWTSTLLVAHSYSFRELHHPEGLMVMMLWVLAAAPASALSVDRLLGRGQHSSAGPHVTASPADDLSPYARWPMRVGQWLLVLVYFSAAHSKLVNGGLDWFNGYTLTYYMLQDGAWNGVPLALWLAGHPLLAEALSVAAWLFEATFVVAVLFRRTAWLYLLLGVAMHMTIYLTQRAPFFTFLAVYLVFLEPLRLSWSELRARIAGRFPALVRAG